jgi:hypothetical protein
MVSVARSEAHQVCPQVVTLRSKRCGEALALAPLTLLTREGRKDSLLARGREGRRLRCRWRRREPGGQRSIGSLLLPRLLLAASAGAIALAPAACRSPTEITVVVTTDFDCADLKDVTITVGALGDGLETAPPTSTSSYCSDSSAGSVVVVPHGSSTAELAIKVVAGFGIKQAEDCAPAAGSSPPDYGPGCIVARRALDFTPHTPLTVPVVMRASCAGIACGETQTCDQGVCVDAGASCSGQTCTTSEQPTPTHWRPMASSSTAGYTGNSDYGAVWTGSQMLVWSGAVNPGGASYDPAADAWAVLPQAPVQPRRYAVVVWSGSEMIGWGGTGASGTTNDGAAYNPGTRAWRTIAPAPIAPRTEAAGVWATTTREMIVWSGDTGPGDFKFYPDGAAYDPVHDSWRTIAASPLAGRVGAGVTWNGQSMVVHDGTSPAGDFGFYDPATDSWTGPFDDPPSSHKVVDGVATAVGATSLFWGGNGVGQSIQIANGISIEGASSVASTLAALPSSVSAYPSRGLCGGWSSNGRLWIWGGVSAAGDGGSTGLDDGAYLDLSSGTWTAMPSAGAPSPRSDFTIVWTGTEAIVWGGQGVSSNTLDDGAIFAP